MGPRNWEDRGCVPAPQRADELWPPAPPPRPLRRSQDLSLYSRASPIRSMAISVTVSQDPPGGSAMSFRLSPPPLPVWRTTDPCGSGTCRRCPELSGLLRAPWSCKASRPICSRSSLRMSLTEKGVEVTGFCSIPEAEGERPGGLRSLRRAAPRAFRPVSASRAKVQGRRPASGIAPSSGPSLPPGDQGRGTRPPTPIGSRRNHVLSSPAPASPSAFFSRPSNSSAAPSHLLGRFASYGGFSKAGRTGEMVRH